MDEGAHDRSLDEALLARAGGELPIRCAWCGRVEIGGSFVEPQTGIEERPSHGICPDCLAQVSGEAEAARRERTGP